MNNRLKKNFHEFLTTIPYNYYNSPISGLSLEQLFIFPELKVLSNNQASSLKIESAIINSRNLLIPGQFGRTVLITGAAESGKTTLFKILIKYYFESLHIPIYLNGRHLTTASEDGLHKLLLQLYKEQYEDTHTDFLTTEAPEKGVLFLDDLDKSGLDIHGMNNIFNMASKHFKYIFIIRQTPINIEYIFLNKEYAETLTNNAAHMEILELGPTQRTHLIEKWYQAMEGSIPDHDEMDEMKITAENLINTVVQGNLIPPLPGHILTVLEPLTTQSLEINVGSSYVHYKEHLIKRALKNHIEEQSLDNICTYISEVANRLLTDDTEVIHQDVLSEIYDQCPNIDDNTISFDGVLESLLKSEIFVRQSGGYGFKYLYVFYYFAARYISDNLDKDETKAFIKKIFTGIENNSNANIMLYLTHFNSEEFIIDLLTHTMDSVHSGHPRLTTGSNLSYIDEVIMELEQLGKRDKKIREARVEYAVLGNQPADIGNLANQSDSEHLDNSALARVQTKECINILRITAQALHQLHQSGSTGGDAPDIDLIASANAMVMRTLSAITTAASQDIAGFIQSNKVTNEDQWIIHQLASYTALRSSTLQIIREFALLLRAGDIETLHNHIKDSGNVVDDMVLLSVILLANINPPPVSEIKRFVQHNPKLKFATDIIKCSLESHIYIYGSENAEIKQLKELFNSHDNTLYGSMN